MPPLLRLSERNAMTFTFFPVTFAGECSMLVNTFTYFNPFLFRSVHLVWDKRTTYSGIKGYRYSIRNDFLNNMPDCFCIDKIKDALTDDIGCLYSGALDLTECLGEQINSKDFNEWTFKFIFLNQTLLLLPQCRISSMLMSDTASWLMEWSLWRRNTTLTSILNLTLEHLWEVAKNFSSTCSLRRSIKLVRLRDFPWKFHYFILRVHFSANWQFWEISTLPSFMGWRRSRAERRNGSTH